MPSPGGMRLVIPARRYFPEMLCPSADNYFFRFMKFICVIPLDDLAGGYRWRTKVGRTAVYRICRTGSPWCSASASKEEHAPTHLGDTKLGSVRDHFCENVAAILGAALEGVEKSNIARMLYCWHIFENKSVTLVSSSSRKNSNTKLRRSSGRGTGVLTLRTTLRPSARDRRKRASSPPSVQ